MHDILPGTGILVAITVGLTLYAWNKPEIFQKWLMNPYIVKRKSQYYRFITSGFIHANWGHLIFNMISLYFLGTFLENVLVQVYGQSIGWTIYGAYYILGIIVSELPTYFKHRDNSNYNSLGASGGVSAVIFSLVLLAPKAQLLVFFIPMPAVVFGILFLAYSWYMGRKGGDFINHDAHLYGALFGILATIILFPESIGNFIYEVTHW